MNNQIIINLKNGSIDDDSLIKVCFCCGKNANDYFKVYIEDVDQSSLRGKVSSYQGRKKFSYPICNECKSVNKRIWSKIIVWSAIFFIAIIVSVIIIDLIKINTNDYPYVYILIIAAGFYPLKMIKEYWLIKDRGGNMVKVIEISEGSAKIQIVNDEAFNLINNHSNQRLFNNG